MLSNRSRYSRRVSRLIELAVLHKYKVIAIVYICLVCYFYFVYSKVIEVRFPKTCSLEESTRFVERLCRNYTDGEVSGSFCNALCVEKEVSFLQCLSHKVEDVILLGEWSHHGKVVLKADGFRKQFRNASTSLQLSDLLEEFVVNYNISLSIAMQILSECDKNSDGMFSPIEFKYCMHMRKREEILYMFLLSGNPAIPTLYGTCGNLMAVEYASSDPLVQLPVTKEYRSWELRAKMAIALIEMVENIENTRYGTLYLCDFQRGNFGFLDNGEGYIAKAIDNDISIFKDDLLQNVKLEMNNTCSTDFDCEFLRCQVPCNHETGKCSGKLVDSNMRILCRMFLQSQTKIFYMGLLWNPPSRINNDLQVLLNECAHPSSDDSIGAAASPSIELPRKLAQQIKTLLHESINYS